MMLQATREIASTTDVNVTCVTSSGSMYITDASIVATSVSGLNREVSERPVQ